jgi:hypothetical protein
MDETYTAIFSAGVGALFGLLAAWAKGYLDYLQGAARELRVAALTCLDRLEKMDQVRRDLPEEIGNEFERLPSDDPRRKTLDHELWFAGCERRSVLERDCSSAQKGATEALRDLQGSAPSPYRA